MKRYLQPCNMTGSLYGKKDIKKGKKQNSVMKSKNKDSLISSYEDLYKTQCVVMSKLFKKSK